MSIVEELSRYGISVWLVGDCIRVFPKSMLSDNSRRIIADNRAALVEELVCIEKELPKPYFNRSGDLVIPFNSQKRYHWWAGGQSLQQTIKEIG